MKKLARPVTLLATALTTLILAVPAQAQSRVFVAAQGSDSNPCTFAAPCRTFQHAHDTVAANGEIDVLDPAGYGALTISKAISIQGHGFSGISAPSANAIAIAIDAAASDKVNLRGLVIDGVGAGGVGIVFNSGAVLNIQDTIIRNFAANGISFLPTTASSLVVSNSVVSDNGSNGIVIITVGTGAVNATVTDSVATGNATGVAFAASKNPLGGPTVLTVIRSTAASNGWGFLANSGVTIRVAQSTVTGNVNGWEADNGAVVQSYGNNYINGNTNNELAPPSVAMK